METLILTLAILVAAAFAAGAVWLLYQMGRAIQRASIKKSQTTVSRVASTESTPLTVRAAIVGGLGLLMLIPLALVQGVVTERSSLYHGVLTDISSSWGQRQELRGPILVIPFVEKHLDVTTETDEDGHTTTIETPRYRSRTAWILPQELNISAHIDTQRRNRGIYDALVFTSDVHLEGSFEPFEMNRLSDKLHYVEWDKAYLTVLLSDTRALDQIAPLSWNEGPVVWEPGTGFPDLEGNGFHAPLDLSRNPAMVDRSTLLDNYRFTIDLDVRGSDGFYFAPLGRTTSTTLSSLWPDPSFQGPILPTDHSVGSEGFEARWEIPQLARDYPQFGLLGDEKLTTPRVFVTGVQLFETVSLYSLISRSAKYGILFIALTYMTFLIFELKFGARLHYVQYGLIGASLALFFLTLLSLAEHAGFPRAYLAAASIAITVITAYTGSALRSWIGAGTIGAMLIGLYGLLFFILHLADYALLVGTGLLTLVLLILMTATRNLGQKRVNSGLPGEPLANKVPI